MIKEIIKKIIETDYCDAKVLDFSCGFLGDEVYICFEKDTQNCWKISFNICASLKYNTDASWGGKWRSNKLVRDMTYPQMGYFCQEISVTENSELEGFYDVYFDLSIMTGNITCKDIIVEQIPIEQVNRFWETN